MQRVAHFYARFWMILPLLLSACAALPPQAPALHKSSDYLPAERIQHRPPQIGLALSGGGQKSAPFEIGVLAALSETGTLSKIDVISSVSGGSYAALFYYTRVAERYGYYVDAQDFEHSPFGDIFLDCLPRALMHDFTATYRWNATSGTGLCPDSHPPRTYWVPHNPQLQHDPLRFASQLRGSQALFATGWSYRDRTKWPLIAGSIAQEIGYGLYNTFIAGPIRLFTDSLFDWNYNHGIEPAKWLYDRGIKRAYGATAVKEPTKHKGRPKGTESTVRHLTFTDLKSIYLRSHRSTCHSLASSIKPCDVPLWVINTTAGTSISPFVLTEPERFTGAINTFEFSPFGYGSGAYGYSEWRNEQRHPNLLQPDLRVATAVGASAAFFDSQQRSVGGFFNPLWNVLLRWGNFDWGTSIPNYNLGRKLYHRARFFHDFLPWPFYLFHRHRGNAEALRIHLSDGGMSEDLGVWALLRRHIPQIIVVDAASDSDYQFDDLCHLALQLSTAQNRPLYVVFQSKLLSHFVAVCEKEQFGQAGPDPFHFHARGNWPAPILKAWICNASRHDPNQCPAHHIVSTLYLIKPVLNWSARPPHGYALKNTIASGRAPNVTEKQCSIPRTAKTSRGYPCEVLSYLSSSGHRQSTYPQDSTVWVSAISSPYIYGAYRALGLYYAKALRICGAANSTQRRVAIDYSDYWHGDTAGATTFSGHQKCSDAPP